VHKRSIDFLRHPDALFIDGQWRPSEEGRTFTLVDSSTEIEIGRVAEASVSDVDLAVAAARRAFDEGPWPRMKPRERAEYLHAIGREMTARAHDLSALWAMESGITRRMSDAVSPSLGGIYHYYADCAEQFVFVERHEPTAGGQHGFLVREPVGVVGAIVPWNGPAMLTAYKCAPALLAGCTMVLKASPEAPGSAYVLAEICEKIGLPEGVLNVITADREASERLVTNPGIDKVAFTGSTATGRRIASLCGERVARYTLELGGKSAAIVMDDYDVGKAAAVIGNAITFMTGQVCSALSRVIVSRRRHDELVEALSEVLSRIRVGDTFDADTDMGPLATARQRERVEGFIKTGLKEGARLAFGGGRPEHLERGHFIEPTIFSNVSNHFAIAQEEIFGPVLSVIPVEDEREAVHVANDSIYGLNASIFCDDVDRTFEMAREVRSGTVGHNDFRMDFGIAFGGFKQSGIGREGGVEGLRAYLESKTIITDALPRAFA
jgi:acyl-CoA reductase-like NAD-dependent aldehyde dehydrogenase